MRNTDTITPKLCVAIPESIVIEALENNPIKMFFKRETKCRDQEGKKRMAKNNSRLLNNLPDLQLLQKKTNRSAQAFRQVTDLNQLPAGLTCGKCRGSTDKLIIQFHVQHDVRLCDMCYGRANKCSTRERMFKQDTRNGIPFVLLRSKRVVGKQIVIFGCVRTSGKHKI